MAKTLQEEILELRASIDDLSTRKIKPSQIELDPLRKKLAEQPFDLTTASTPGSVVVSMLGDDVNNEFLKVYETRDTPLEVAMGVSSVTFGGGGGFGSEIVIAHPFNSENIFPILTPEDRVIQLGAHSITSSTFTVWSYTSYASLAAGNYGFRWIALG